MPMSHEPRSFDNPGMPPSTWALDTKVRVVFVNGRCSLNAYPISALRWTRSGDAWDVAKFWKES